MNINPVVLFFVKLRYYCLGKLTYLYELWEDEEDADDLID